jgi:fructoselysine 6-kinase
VDNAINRTDGAVANRGKLRIAAVGDNCIDVYVGDHEARFPGGNALNVAALCAQDGLASAYLGTVGDDDYGSALVGAAREAGVDVSRVERRPGSTGITTVRLVDGEREFLSEEYGVSLSFDIGEAVTTRLAGYDWVHVSRIDDRDGRLAAVARRGVPISREFGTELRLGEATPATAGDLSVAFFSAADRAEATTQAAELVASGAKLAIATIGAEGAIAVDADSSHHQPALASDPVDTLGAGDAFIAGFVGSRLRGADVRQSMRSAASSAAHTCARLGAWGALEQSEVS